MSEVKHSIGWIAEMYGQNYGNWLDLGDESVFCNKHSDRRQNLLPLKEAVSLLFENIKDVAEEIISAKHGYFYDDEKQDPMAIFAVQAEKGVNLWSEVEYPKEVRIIFDPHKDDFKAFKDAGFETQEAQSVA